MLELILKLLEKLAKLAELKETERRSYYTDVLKPVLADFEELHLSYLDRLRTYRKVAQSEGFAFDAERLRKSVVEDIRFKQHLPASFLAKLELLRSRPQLVSALRNYVLWEEDYTRLATSHDTVILPSRNYVTQMQNASSFTLLSLQDDALRDVAERGAAQLRAALVKYPSHVKKKQNHSKIRHDPNDELRLAAVQQIDIVVDELQKRYGKVHHEFQKAIAKALKVS